MEITFYSCFSAGLWCSLFILLTYLLCRAGAGKRKLTSTSIPIVLYALSMLWFVLPVDFPNAFVLPDSRVYPKLYTWLTEELFTVGTYPISAAALLIVVWIVGACVGLFRYGYEYYRVFCNNLLFTEPAGEAVQAVYRKILREEKRPLSISVRTGPQVGSPHGLGVFRKVIMLPDMAYSERELYYILKHEYTHFRNHDTLLKQITVLFSKVFWWNPLVLLLMRDLEQSVEIRCDLAVTKHMDKGEKYAYMETLVKAVKEENRCCVPLYGSTPLSDDDDRTNKIMERFRMITSDMENSKAVHLKNFAIIAVFSVLMFLSYATIWQPNTEAPLSTESIAFDFDASNAYILENQKNEYWVCIAGGDRFKISEESAEFFLENGFNLIKESET
ncbi:MAG: M56 family metallopeptidase [Clostridiaceae bacterium]|nr:M56 family metallopeptidase [Clostridiaceae bacterium]